MSHVHNDFSFNLVNKTEGDITVSHDGIVTLPDNRKFKIENLTIGGKEHKSEALTEHQREAIEGLLKEAFAELNKSGTSYTNSKQFKITHDMKETATITAGSDTPTSAKAVKFTYTKEKCELLMSRFRGISEETKSKEESGEIQRSGINSPDRTNLYFGSGLQVLRSLSKKQKDLLRTGDDAKSKYYDKILTKFESGEQVPAKTIAEWIDEAKSLGLNDAKAGERSDPSFFLETAIDTLFQKSGSKRMSLLENEKKTLVDKKSGCLQFDVRHQYSDKSSLGELLEEENHRVLDYETAPPCLMFSIRGRLGDSSRSEEEKEYKEKVLKAPHQLKVQTTEENTDTEVGYTLKSVIILDGKSSEEANHYFTLELISKPGEEPVRWMKYNDAVVTEIQDTNGEIQSLIEKQGHNLIYTKEEKA